MTALNGVRMKEYFTKKEAVQFIVGRAGGIIPKCEKRAWRNRLNLTFNRKAPIHDGDKYTLEQILTFARANYGLDHFKDYPLPPINGSIQAQEGADIFAASAYVFSTPSNHEECQPLFAKLYGEIHQLKEEIRKRDDRIAELEPMAKRYEEICQRLSNIAKLPRKN